jgi:hypothetical protein
LAVVNSTPPAALSRDANGIAEGGIRLPDVEVPVGLNDGNNSPVNLTNPLNVFCILWGTHRDFTQDQLNMLYLNNGDYRAQVVADLRLLQDQHFVLPEDVPTLTHDAFAHNA